MTLQEAYRLLQRYDDWRTGRDRRTFDDAFNDTFANGEMSEAFGVILAAGGLTKAIADCSRCRHCDEDAPVACTLGVKGECTKFEEVKG